MPEQTPIKPAGVKPRSARPSRARWWLFFLVAVSLTLALLPAFEGLCVVCDWGRPELHDDPFVGFRSVRPLFVPSEDEASYEIPKARQMFFRPQSFAAEKPAGEFRVFCLGGSTVQGRPYAVETSFTSWLEISLQAADPGRSWHVINCGGVSYASYRLTMILEEVLAYEPDLIILYTGHNEFLESRSFDHIKHRGELSNAAIDGASRLRSFTLVREAYLRMRGISSDDPLEGRPLLPTEVEALLDGFGGLEKYHRDEDWHRGVIAQYRFNLQRMIELAHDAAVRVILVNPASNIRDTPPFKSQHQGDLTADELAEWESLCAAARQHLHGDDYDVRESAKLFEQACQIDALHAGTFYTLGHCYLAMGKTDLARAALLRAKELDVCPLRILAPMNQAVLESAESTDTPLVDAQDLFERASPDEIVGARWLVDHVHPSITGHQLLADALADELVSLGLVTPRADWQEAKNRLYRQHRESLDELYFLQGSKRLEAVKKWARGRVEVSIEPSEGEK
ncbi:MAG: SGNH/GDSL hydrolase family protein [Planctomycetes bacterium]|nr:SGNH/GDSL hydrolase family protein [Planctomycetota bacterium]